MKTNILIKVLNLFLFILIYKINYSLNRELEPPEVILENLANFLQTGYYPNKTIILDNQYYFNISYVQPILTYKKYSIFNDSIKLIEPKLILFFTSELYIRYPSKIEYCIQGIENNNLSVSILMDINFTSIIFNKLEDNSYKLEYSFNNNNFSENSKIKFNNIENYSFFPKDQIKIEAKNIFFELYINRIISHLEEYPESDELYLFNKIKDYIQKTKKFNSTRTYSFELLNPEIISFSYENFIKIEVNKLKVINIEITIEYCFLGEISSYIRSCVPIKRTCTFNDIIIQKKDIIYGDFTSINNICQYEEEYLIRYIINLSKDLMIPFL